MIKCFSLIITLLYVGTILGQTTNEIKLISQYPTDELNNSYTYLENITSTASTEWLQEQAKVSISYFEGRGQVQGLVASMMEYDAGFRQSIK